MKFGSSAFAASMAAIAALEPVVGHIATVRRRAMHAARWSIHRTVGPDASSGGRARGWIPGRSCTRRLELQESGFTGIGGQACPFYERLTGEFLRDVERGGPVWDWLEPHASETFDKAYVLRLLGALHRMALAGDDAELVAHFPSTGGDGDAAATYRVVERLLADPPPVMADMMTRPPQTNEVGRSIGLASGCS